MRLVLIFVFWGIATGLLASTPKLLVNEFVDVEMAASGAPGLAYTIFENGEIYSEARGEILVGSGRKVTTETPFLLGSISKSFTAMAVMQLVEAGKVELDAEISQYLEVFSTPAVRGITIRQLLSHTSGYSTFQGNIPHKDKSKSKDEHLSQIQQIAKWTPAYTPGSKWEYSNANYVILGFLIEALSGQDYANYIKANILEPIGMEHSFVGDQKSHDMIAVGHRPWFGTKRPYKTIETERDGGIASAGGIIASASDMGLYLAIMLNDQDDIISAESKSMMMRPASDASPYYGFGWSIDTEDDAVFHTGISPGVETLAILVPAEQKGAVVLVNAGSGMGFGETTNLRFGTSAKALGLDYIGNSGQWGRKILFLSFVALPIFFVIAMINLGLNRTGLYAKSGPFGAFSLWFPLLMTIGLAWTCLYLIPQLFGVSIGGLIVFLPDMAMAMVATAMTGVAWALLRLGLFYGGRPSAG
ncbi:serine hydrolase domain-containing protein [Hyphococcus lacteus]|uniref:Serine hydrolase domain-containing protein n=1 Tax=Hyphococcus lacteus TaxID=3143536 RepID=A0ABV3Z6M6_9PROT